MIRFLRVLMFFVLLIAFPVGILVLLWWWLQQQDAYAPTLMGAPELAVVPQPTTAIEIPEEALKSPPPDIAPPAGVVTIPEAVSEDVAVSFSMDEEEVQFSMTDDSESSDAEAAVEEESVPDALKRIEGIGPKVAALLQEAGILSFAQLAETEVETLASILAEAGLQFMKPDAWPEQAALAAAEDWDGLAKLQDKLKGGRRA